MGECFFKKISPRFRKLFDDFLILAKSITDFVFGIQNQKVSPYFYTRDIASSLPSMKKFIKHLDARMKHEDTQLYAKLNFENQVRMVFDLVWNSLTLEPEVRINKEKLDENYLDLENCIGYSQPGNIAWAYLHQFETTIQQFMLGDALRIRKSNPLELALFNQEGISVKSRTKSKFIIETKDSKDFLKSNVSVDGKGIRNQLSLMVREQFRDAVSVMRILKPSGVGISSVWYRIEPLRGLVMDAEQVPFPDLAPPALCPMGEVVCVLSDRQVDLAKKLWYRLNRARNAPEQYSKLLLAIDTFDVALCSSRKEDLIRDVYVMFETIFTVKGKKLDSIIATLNSDTDVEKEELETFLKKCRKLRDASTHGSRVKSDIPLDFVKNIASISSEILSYSLASMEVSDGIEGLVNKTLGNNELGHGLRKKLRNWSPKLTA
jgi:hypothetical protein